MDEYSAHYEELVARYAADHLVLVLQKVRRVGLSFRQCTWPNFNAAVLPYCEVVLLSSYELVDGQQTRAHELGWVNQALLLTVLGGKCRREETPARHLVLDDPLDGEDQYQLLRHVRPSVQAALSDSLAEGV